MAATPSTTTPGSTAEPSSEQTSGADAAKEKAAEATDQVKQAASDATDQAMEKASEAAGQAKSMVRDQVDQRSTQAGEQVATHAESVRTVAEELRKQGQDGPAQMATQAADRAEKLGSYLRDSDSDRLLSDLEDMGRSNPWAVILGGAALGFAASRMLKASSSNRYQVSRGSSQPGSYRQLPSSPATPAQRSSVPNGHQVI